MDEMVPKVMLVLLVQRVKMVFLGKMEHPGQWVQEVHQVKEGDLDLRVLLVPVVMMVLREQLDNLVPLALPELQDFQALQVLRVKQVLLVPQALMVPLDKEENLVQQVMLVQLVLLAILEEMETQEVKVKRALLAFLVLLD